VWLTVASGLVDISCDRGGMGSWFECQVTFADDSTATRTGLFAFEDGRDATEFEAEDDSQYGSWDGCSIHLKDGRTLVEVEVITSGRGVSGRRR